MRGWQKRALIFESFIFWNFFHWTVASPVSNVGDWIWWIFQNQWVNVAYGVCRTNVIVLIWVSVVLPFHECLHLLRLDLYTVSTPRVNNDAAIVAHICYISLLRCNYICWDATITTSIWLVNRKTLWTIHKVQGELRTAIWRALSYFVENCLVAA